MPETLFLLACGLVIGFCSVFPIRWATRHAVGWWDNRPRQRHKRCLRNIERLEIELGIREQPDRHALGGIWQVRPKNFHQLVEVQRRYEELAAKHYGPQGGRTYKQAYLRAIERLEHGDQPSGRRNGK